MAFSSEASAIIDFVKDVTGQISILLEELRMEADKLNPKNVHWIVLRSQMVGIERAESAMMDVFIELLKNEMDNTTLNCQLQSSDLQEDLTDTVPE